MIEIIAIPAPATVAAWPEAIKHLAEPIALSRGCYEPEDVFGYCQKGDMQLWLVAEDEAVLAACVTEIVNYPRKRVVRAVFCGGREMSKWLGLMDSTLEGWSKGWGCTGIELLGRRGWSRVVQGDVLSVVIRRDYPSMEVH